MSDLAPINENQSSVDLETLKSLYYMVNAKPDTSIKLFNTPKRVSIADIISLNDKIQSKLKNHNIHTSITSVTIIFDNGVIKSFSIWEEFKRTDWDTSEITESASISWDVSIILPNFKLPQRHTIKVRIGTSLNPSEYFQLITTSDNEAEIMENRSFLVCKVDFVNSIISNELIFLIEEWYKCLANLEMDSKLRKFTENYPTTIARFIHYCTIIASFGVLYLAFQLSINSIKKFEFSKVMISELYFWLIMIFATYFISEFIGKYLGHIIYKTIKKLELSCIFHFTKGDKNLQEEIDKTNTGKLNQIKLQLVLTVVGTIISISLNWLAQLVGIIN